MTISSLLSFAFQWRQKLGLFEKTEVLRIFYGPCESNHPELKKIAIEVFGEHAWITIWEPVADETLNETLGFLRTLKLNSAEFAVTPINRTTSENTTLKSIVLMDRSKIASDANVRTLWGTPPEGRFSATEFSIPYLLQFQETKHPGLFLDHAPLRRWLMDTQKEKKVLNLFSYTGSLSVAAARGGASHVTTLDLSKSTIEWAQENWKNAGLEEARGNFIYGDVFEWLPRLVKKGEMYDTILSDPPSFSRSKNGVFSTQKDSGKLHELIFPLLKVGGVLVSSINSESLSEQQFLREIDRAAENLRMGIQILGTVDLPESFPTHSHAISERYLKGFYVLRTG